MINMTSAFIVLASFEAVYGDKRVSSTVTCYSRDRSVQGIAIEVTIICGDIRRGAIYYHSRDLVLNRYEGRVGYFGRLLHLRDLHLKSLR